MQLLNVIEAPLKDWNVDRKKAVPAKTMLIREPSEEDLEKAIAYCNINELEALIIYG